MIEIPNNSNYHRTAVQIRFDDIDIAAHVNNGVYQSYFDLAKTYFFDELFGKLINWKIKGLVLAHIEIDYYEPTYLGDKIIVETIITKLGKKSIDLVQVVREQGTKGEKGIKCVGHSVMVGYHYREAYSFELPIEWRNKIKPYISEND